MALVMSSATPLLLLDEQLVVRTASVTFCRAFDLRVEAVVGSSLFALGKGEWNEPQLRALLVATASGGAAMDAYAFDLNRLGKQDRSLVLTAHALDQVETGGLRLVLAVADNTAMRAAQKAAVDQAQKCDSLVQEKQLLLQESNHRVANSLQIIASILMQRVKKVQSEEARTHLREAHHRVMAIANLQRLLASNPTGEVALKLYLTNICASIGASLIGDPSRLTLKVSADDSVMNPDQSVSVGLIVTELAINSLKHAFPDVAQQQCHIDVVFVASPSGWVLTVSDNGCGLPDNASESKPGLGTGIINALAGQLAATAVVTYTDPGTKVTISHAATSAGQTTAGVASESANPNILDIR